jgi:hypothetical protein
LSLLDDLGESHQYDIPGALYDPESPFNLLGIPFLSKYFKDQKTMGTEVVRIHTLFGIMRRMNATSHTVLTVFQLYKSMLGSHTTKPSAVELTHSTMTTSSSPFVQKLEIVK